MRCQMSKSKRSDQFLEHHQRKIIDFSDSDVKAADKVGRSARRMVDTHMKNVLSKPLVATTMRRMTAMFNFLPDPRMFGC